MIIRSIKIIYKSTNATFYLAWPNMASINRPSQALWKYKAEPDPACANQQISLSLAVGKMTGVLGSLLLVLCAVSVLADHGENAPLYTDADFADKTAERPHFVMFFAPWYV